MDRGGFEYISPEVNLTVTSAGAGFVLTLAKAVFKKTSNNIWRMSFNINCSLTASTTIVLVISGVTFPASNQGGGLAPQGGVAGSWIANGGGSQLAFYFASSTFGYSSGEVELASKPTAYLPDGV